MMIIVIIIIIIIIKLFRPDISIVSSCRQQLKRLSWNFS